MAADAITGDKLYTVEHGIILSLSLSWKFKAIPAMIPLYIAPFSTASGNGTDARIGDIFTDQFHLSNWQSRLTTQVYFAGSLILGIFPCLAADKYSRKPTAVRCILMSGPCGLLAAASPCYTFFLLMRFFQGACFTMLNNTISFLLSLLIPTTVEPMTITKYSADVAANAPWYLPRTELFIDSSGPAQSPPVDLTECSKECITVEDCPFDQSCFGATLARPGCCLPALTPNATGCVSDEQCRRSCDSTVCDMEQQPSRCLCEPGTHFLFEKCWKRCPPFAEERPIVDERGFSYCKLRTSESVARLVMHRSKRSIGKNAFC